MNDLHPEWGPAKHRTETARTAEVGGLGGTATALDLRDGAGERPDDN